MNDHIRKELEPIISALRFTSEESFEFDGRAIPITDHYASMHRGASPAKVLPPVVARLQNHLYAHCFTQRFPAVSAKVSRAAPTDFRASLSTANAGTERWERGWQIDQLLSTGAILIHRQGEYRVVWPGEFVYQEGFARAPQAGAIVSLFLSCESFVAQPGYYFAFSQTPADQLDERYLFRLYWNVQAASAPQLLRDLTTLFNHHGVPFRFKLPVDPAGYARVDTAVTYIPLRFFSLAIDLAINLQSSLSAALSPAVPLFTRPLAPGLAFAEDPGATESFGTARCRVLAHALWSAYATGSSGMDASLSSVEASFQSEGISLDHPYLNPGSPVYEFPGVQSAA